jgi:hypothetical protein
MKTAEYKSNKENNDVTNRNGTKEVEDPDWLEHCYRDAAIQELM